MDDGNPLVSYHENNEYWKNELRAARERSFGCALARMAETFHYAKKRINKFIDIGTGPGYFLDAVKLHLPTSSEIFYGVEKYPPKPEERSTSSHYIVGDLGDIKLKFEAGMCIEVIEHLTPKMLDRLVGQLTTVSENDALFIFNTGMPEYVINDDTGYLDPTKRGHIASYSLQGINHLANKNGFFAKPIPGKTWAFVLEKNQDQDNICDRIWKACPENLRSLEDPKMGSVLRILGLESARAYLHQ